MMSEQQFDARYAEITREFDQKSEAVTAVRDREIVRLYQECGWGQEKIAHRVSHVTGKRITQQRISQTLNFGRFLDFTTVSCKSEKVADLTEWRFREFWRTTRGKGNEQERFQLIAHMVDEGIPHGRENKQYPPGIRDAILDCLEDGQWYSTNQVLATVEETLFGVTLIQIQDCLKEIRKRPPEGKQVQSKKIGRTSQYRLKKVPKLPASALDPNKILELYEQVKPLIEELHHWGSSHRFNQSPTSLKNIAIKLERLFDALLAKETA